MFKFYDDELHNLILVADKNIREIISYTSNYDFHPPLQYILNKISLEVFGLNEFLLALPSIIFTLLTMILSSRLLYKITKSFSWSVVSGILMLLHPLVFLWGKSIRWYPIWTFLTILSIYLFISIWNSERIRKNNAKFIVLAVIVAISFYTNYQTLVVIASIILTSLTLDKKEGTWIHTKQTFNVIGIALFFSLPYLITFLSHFEGFFSRKGIYEEFTGTSPLITGIYFLYSVVFGQSLFPWNVSFIIFFIFGSAAFIAGITFYNKLKKEIGEAKTVKTNVGQSILKIQIFRQVVYITVFLIILSFVYSLIAGINAARGLIVLPMLLVLILSTFGHYIYNNYKYSVTFKKVFYLFFLFAISILFLWLIGSYNVISKQHLHKNGLAIPLQEILRIIESEKTITDSDLAIITTDFVLTYYLMNEGELKVLSPYSNELMKLFVNKKEAESGNMDRIIFIDSYPGSLMPLKSELDNYKAKLFKAGEIIFGPINLAYDSDYRMKKRFFPSSEIGEWRYKIFILEPKASWDTLSLKKINDFKVY